MFGLHSSSLLWRRIMLRSRSHCLNYRGAAPGALDRDVAIRHGSQLSSRIQAREYVFDRLAHCAFCWSLSGWRPANCHNARLPKERSRLSRPGFMSIRYSPGELMSDDVDGDVRSGMSRCSQWILTRTCSVCLIRNCRHVNPGRAYHVLFR